MIRDWYSLFSTSGWRNAARLIAHSLRLRRYARPALTLLVLQGMERNGLCDALLAPGGLDSDISKGNPTLQASCEYLSEVGLLELRGSRFCVRQPRQFRAWMRVVYAYMAYAEPAQSLDKLIGGQWRYGEDTARDDRYDAIASAGLTSSYSYRFAAAMIAETSARCIVDLGCGTGAFPSFLSEQIPSGDFWGVDLAKDAIEEGHAQGLDGKRVHLVVGDITDLKSVPLGETPIDLFCLMFVLHEFDDSRVAQILRSIRDTFPPASVLLIELVGQESTSIPRRSVFPELKFVHEISGQILRDPEEWTRLFRMCGFDPVAEKRNNLTNHVGLCFAPVDDDTP